MKNRLLLYVHFNKENKLSEHVVYQLQEMKKTFGEIMFISNSVVSQEDLAFLKENNLITDFMQRPNQGYDFVAWSEAMKRYGFQRLAEYDSVTIMNDTCFGPIFDFEPIFSSYEQRTDVDFWGITNNRKHSEKIWGEKIIFPDHIQSYFVSYSQNIVKEKEFEAFWGNVIAYDDVLKMIVNYEVAMTKFFEDAGFKSAVLFDTRKEDWMGMPHADFSLHSLPLLVQKGIPFLKVKAFSFNGDGPTTSLTMEYLQDKSDYPLEYIVKHMSRIDYPDRPYMLNFKFKDYKVQKTNLDKIATKKVAIHLHVFYTELLEAYLVNFEKYIGKYDLYLTTDTELKREKIEKILLNHSINVSEIMLTGNKGRDVLPWMMINQKMKTYDFVGHFHTKKSDHVNWIIGESWRDNLIEALIKPAQQIFTDLIDNPEVGLVISDVPSFFQYHRGPAYKEESKLWPYMISLWQQVFGEGENSLHQKDSYTMSYGTMVWYRPGALDNLLNTDIKEQVPEEPLPFETILHAFERLLVYVAWKNGYDYRISKIKEYNSFLANISLNNTLREFDKNTSDIRARELVSLLIKKIKFMVKYRLLKIIGKR